MGQASLLFGDDWPSVTRGSAFCVRDDCADTAVGRSVVDHGDHCAIDELRRYRLETGQRVVAAVPVDDDDVDYRRAQDDPPIRRLMRSRNERERSGTWSVAAKTSL